MVPLDNDAIADRLKRLREVYGLPTQVAMAAHLEVEFNRYNTAERGMGLSKEVAILICQKFAGVTLDWLYFGKMDGLPFELARRIGGLPTAAAPPPRRRGG